MRLVDSPSRGSLETYGSGVSLVRRAACALVAVLILAPTAASAGSEVVRDHPRDVVRVHWTGSDCDTMTDCHRHRTVAHEHRFGDIVWSRGDYRRHQLVLTMNVRGMTERKSRATYVGWDITAADGSEVDTQILYSRGDVDVLVLGSAHGFRCPDAAAQVRTRRHQYVLRIPATCLDRTPWVRLSASTLVSGDRSDWHDVAGLGHHLKLTYEVPEKSFGRRIHRAPATP